MSRMGGKKTHTHADSGSLYMFSHHAKVGLLVPRFVWRYSYRGMFGTTLIAVCLAGTLPKFHPVFTVGHGATFCTDSMRIRILIC